MVQLSPIIKLDAKETFEVLEVVPVKLAVVRLQDLVLRDSLKFKKTFRKVVSAGGLHGFLDFSGQILLSLIMKDEIIAKYKPERYAVAINALKPDSYTTIDGETYEGEDFESWNEIERIHSQNEQLISLCPKCEPIGLVKGCNLVQIKHHIRLLKSLGILDFVFHVGDFFRHGDPHMIRRARIYSSEIRKHARCLILCGMGSQRRIREFSFADFYVSFKHFVTARNGMRFIGTKEVKYTGSYSSKIITSNFIEMYKNIESMSKDAKLTSWMKQ